MFALALWDGPRERLVLARDRLGKKPLVWTTLPDGTLAFASELKALLRLPEVGPRAGSRRPRRLPRARLRARHGDRDPRHPPPPAGTRARRRKAERSGSSAGGEPEPAAASATEAEWLERVRETVGAAVRRRLAADVPLGALLSGGIDSSIVVALMAQAGPEPVRTFTVGFADASYDERTYAHAVAERFGTRHEEVVLEPDAAEVLAPPRGGVRRAARRRGGATALPRLRGRQAPRDGGADRRRRRRVVRRLRALRGDAARRPGGPAPRGHARPRGAHAPGRPRRAPLVAVPSGTLPRRRRRAGRGALRPADGGLPRRTAGRALGRRGPPDLGAPARRRHRVSPGSSSSTSPPTSPATCCRRRTSPRWRTRSSCARRCSTTRCWRSASRSPTS